MKYEAEKTREETGMCLRTSITIKSVNCSICQSYNFNLKTLLCFAIFFFQFSVKHQN